MKKITFQLITISLIASILFVSNSCKKEEESVVPKYQSAVDNSKAENLFNGAFKQVSQYSVVVDTTTKNGSKDYPILTITGAGYPKTFTLDYGTRTICEDGRTRSDKIITQLSAPYLDSATIIVSTFDNYYETINNVDYHLTGTHTVTNTGHNSAGHPVYRVAVTNASVSTPDGPSVGLQQDIASLPQDTTPYSIHSTTHTPSPVLQTAPTSTEMLSP